MYFPLYLRGDLCKYIVDLIYNDNEKSQTGTMNKKGEQGYGVRPKEAYNP